jgi:hypothetical protein
MTNILCNPKGGFMKNKSVSKVLALTVGLALAFSTVSCATGPKVRSQMSGITSVIRGGTLSLWITGKQVIVTVSSTEDGTGAVAPGTTVTVGGTLTVDANETAQNLYVTAASAVDETQHTLQIRLVTVTDVVITPATATIEQGKSTAFSARVNGTNNPNQNVSWTVGSNPDGTGTVRPSTLMIAGALNVASDQSSAVYVKATSVVDPSKSAVVRVNVTAAPSAAAAPAASQPAASQQPAQQQQSQQPAQNQQSLVGRWRSTGGVNTVILTFNADGTGTYDLNGSISNTKWTVSGDRLTLTTLAGSGEYPNTYTYSISGNTLTTIAGSITTTYTR